MSGSVNKVILVGNLGRDPESRTTQDGSTVVNLAVATTEKWKDKSSGQNKERTEWHRVVIFNDRLARVARNFLKKGSKVYIEGQIQTHKWTDQAGQEKYTTEIVLGKFRGDLTMLDSKQAQAEAPHQPRSVGDSVQQAAQQMGAPLDDPDIPF